ncbi:hypothetical protein VTH06DRAFT_3442 [Thermothelomyces fergusii]
MKSVASIGLVTALFCSAIATAGSTPHKMARGSNRVTCFAKIDHTEPSGKDMGKDKHGGKDKGETVRTLSIYSWSFVWNFAIFDDCGNILANLSSLIPLLGRGKHDVECRVEIGWSPSNAAHEGAYGAGPGYHGNTLEQSGRNAGNQSWWDYAGHVEIDISSLPAKMEWPLIASFDRPDQLAKSGKLGAKYEKAAADAANTFKIHGSHGNDFFLSWGSDLQDGKPGYGDDKKDGHEKESKDKKKNHGKNKSETLVSVSNRHGKLQGHYNTGKIFSC